MERFWARFALLLLLHASLSLLSVPVHSDVNKAEEADLLAGINSFRQSAKAPPLTKHDKADCVADEIADKLENKKCATDAAATITQSQLISDYSSVLEKCKVDANTTADGMILPVCVPKRVATLVLTNYTQSGNSRYLNNSRFAGVGIGGEDDWTVVVLTTNTQGGSFASGARRCVAAAVVVAQFVLLVGFVVFVF